MEYTKPQLHGHSAIEAIQETGSSAKVTDVIEFNPQQQRPSDPAYQADE